MLIQELKKQLDKLPLHLHEKTSSDLVQHLNELVGSGGKKFRPGLLYLIGYLFDLPIENLEVYARSVELTHLASLVHDDVIDESSVRRNFPTLNSIKNNTTAILAGDYLLASIMAELAKQNRNEVLIDLTKSIKDLADGEWLQYNLKQKSKVSFEDLEEVSLKKTGSLIRWCCTTPARLADYEDVNTLARIGERVGLIFQMADDIVDGLPDSGKPQFLDILNGQINFVTQKLVTLYPQLENKLMDLRFGNTKNIPWSAEDYKHAMLEVHRDIENEKEQVLKAFSTLCDEYSKPELKDLFEMMITKIQSNYHEQLHG